MTSTITSTTIESSAYDNIFSYIDDRSIVVDPRDQSNTSKRPFVYDSDPFAKSLNFGLFPYIVVEFPTLQYSKTSTDGTRKEITWSVSITVRHAREGAGQTINTKGKQDMFLITDSLNVLFNTNTYKKQLNLLGIFFTNLEKVSVSTLAINQKDVYEAVYTLTFMNRMTVSS